MKIAVATDDGKTISRHFGRALYYLVFTANRGDLIDKEWRTKPFRRQFAHEPLDHRSDDLGYGFGTHLETRHEDMMEVIRDCDAIIVADVICGSYLEMKAINICPFVTEIEDVEQAVSDFLDGQRVEYTEWLH